MMAGIPGSACKTDQADENGVGKKSPPAATFVRGNCRYINKDDVNVKVQRADPGWDCGFTTYRISSGMTRPFRWLRHRLPRFEDRTIALDEFSMGGPGRLSLTCPSTINPTVGSLSDCKIAWYNQFVPESSNFHGVCGDKVSIPGFYVSTTKDAKTSSWLTRRIGHA